ncbi:MAG: universal stress protein [bacterium]
MIKSIVAALDGSAESLLGLKLGASWAGQLDAELRAVFVERESRFVEFPSYSDSEGTVPRPVELPEERLREVEAAFKAEEAELMEKFNSITERIKSRSSLKIIRGNVRSTLVREARSADLAIIGKKGVEDLPHLKRVGPFAEAVIREALRPVLLVPEKNSGKGPLLIAFDGGNGVHRVLPVTMELALALKLPLTVLTVSKDPETARSIQEPLRAFLDPYGIEYEFRVKASPDGAAREILATAREIDASMIAMGAFSHTPFAELFFGSTTRDVLEDVECPVLMMT